MRAVVGALALLGLTGCATDVMPDTSCDYDQTALLALDYETFENDFDAGWRPIAEVEGCELAAADLIEAYRDQTSATPDQTGSLKHHEAQLRAAQGQTAVAINLHEALLPMRADNLSMLHYHQAEIAFLSQDLPGLRAARERMASLPPPDGFEAAVDRFKERFPDSPPPSWPINLDVVDGFISCFDEPYCVAYSFECRPNGSEPTN